MQKSSQKIAYRYEDSAQGGAVRIETKDTRAAKRCTNFCDTRSRSIEPAIRCT
jgi:hypothetical protein